MRYNCFCIPAPLYVRSLARHFSYHISWCFALVSPSVSVRAALLDSNERARSKTSLYIGPLYTSVELLGFS